MFVNRIWPSVPAPVGSLLPPTEATIVDKGQNVLTIKSGELKVSMLVKLTSRSQLTTKKDQQLPQRGEKED